MDDTTEDLVPDEAVEAAYMACVDQGWVFPFGASVRDHPDPAALRVADLAAEQENKATISRILAAAESSLLAEVARLRAERDALAAALAVVEEALAAYWEHNPPGTPGYNPAVAEALDLLTSRVVLAEHAEGQ